jgi:hypothetical protein
MMQASAPVAQSAAAIGPNAPGRDLAWHHVRTHDLLIVGRVALVRQHMRWDARSGRAVSVIAARRHAQP